MIRPNEITTYNSIGTATINDHALTEPSSLDSCSCAYSRAPPTIQFMHDEGGIN